MQKQTKASTTTSPAKTRLPAARPDPARSVDLAIETAGSNPSDAVRVYLHLHYASGIIIKRVDRHLSRWNLSVARYTLLRLLLNYQAMTLTELSKSHECGAGNITALVDRLERDRLVRRIAYKQDKRITQVALTAKGRSVVTAAMEPHRQFVEQLMGVLGPEEINGLGRMIDALAKRAQDQA
ncbi:MarR family transcriptional regulator [Roseiarcaceae bacterium H3SJ34-1]|uniref:MarR family winged helix-turn-helix transcriptional regulator n=1 Tax=Terripilifer ovatus TaxID=3032367 RepID=UPI003AB9A51F|nr:MarR family transcriptional regulator [Roseiarcaceae bacterium H3SJ34-1]